MCFSRRGFAQVRSARKLEATDDAIPAEVELLATRHPDALVLAERREDELTFAWCSQPQDPRLARAVFYNDYGDYEDDIALGDSRWLATVLGSLR